MARTKDAVLSIRTTTPLKSLIQNLAAQERRSVASMVEVIALDYAERNGTPPVSKSRSTKKGKSFMTLTLDAN